MLRIRDNIVANALIDQVCSTFQTGFEQLLLNIFDFRQRKIESVLLLPDHNVARDVIERNLPKNCNEVSWGTDCLDDG